jgi:hypothetical protein
MKRTLAISVVSIAVVASVVWSALPNPQPSVGLYFTSNSDPTIGLGVAAPLGQLLIRQDSPSLYFKSGAANTSWTIIGKGTSSGGSVTSVACGVGELCSPSPITTSGTISLNITPTTCASGMAQVSTASDGTSMCSMFFDVAASGLTSSGSTVELLQSCSNNQVLAWNGATWACSTPATGSVTSIATTAPIAGGPIVNSGTLSLNESSNFRTNGGNLDLALAVTMPGSLVVDSTTNSIGALSENGNRVFSIATSGLASSGPTVELLQSCSSGQVLAWNGVTWACFTPTGGTVTSVACGVGLSCSPSPIIGSGTASLNITPTTCAAGNAETATASDGTSTCAPFVPSASVAGTTNQIAKFTSASSVGNSLASDTGTLFTVPEAVALTMQVAFSGMIAPTAFSGTRVDNFNPSGLSGTFTIQQNATAPTTITGILAQPTGTFIRFTNVSSGSAITFTNLDSNSSAANQFLIGGSVSTILYPGNTFWLQYNGSQWRLAANTTEITGTTNSVIKVTAPGVYGSSLIADDINGVVTMSTVGGTEPLQFYGGGAGTWGISPLSGSNTESQTITIFEETPTTTPSVNGTLFFYVKPGTGGVGGVQLSPNGVSYFDPDNWAEHAAILAIGHESPQYELDVRDPGNAHTSTTDCINAGSQYECKVINALGTSTFATGTGSGTTYLGGDGNALGSRISGTALLTNVGLRGNAANGDINLALETLAGNVILNNTSGTTDVKGVCTLDSTTTVTGSAVFNVAGGEAHFGPTIDDVWTSGGAINFGYADAATDHLWINFSGTSSANQSRDLYIGDGEHNQVAIFTGAAKSLEMKGAFTGDTTGLFKGILTEQKGIKDNGTAPTITLCGTGPVYNGGIYSGTVAEGTVATGCVITWSAAMTSPSCTISSQSGLVFTYSYNTTSLTIVNVGALSSTSIDFQCTNH